MPATGGAAATDPPAPGHDVVSVLLGCIAAGLLAASAWLVDRSGPEPFYKGPLVFPLIALGLVVAASVPAAWRLARERPRDPARIDGRGFPRRGALFFLIGCAYPPAIAAIGLQAASFVTVALAARVAGTPTARALWVAAAIAGALHLAFRTLLDLWFPAPWLPALIGA